MTINDQPHLSNDQLRSLLEPFLERYDLALRTGWTLRDTDRALFRAGQATSEPN